MQQDMQKYRLSDLTRTVIATHQVRLFESEPETNTIKELWCKYEIYPSVVELIDYLGNNPRVDEIFGATINTKSHQGRLVGRYDIGDKHLRIGIITLNISPLRWLWLLEANLDNLPSGLINDLEQIVREMLITIKKIKSLGG